VSIPNDFERPKKKAPAALLAAQVRFKPGKVGRRICKAKRRRDGGQCGHLAAHGFDTCAYHHRGIWGRIKKLGHKRCAAKRVKRPQGQCGQLCAPGEDVCSYHVRARAAGTLVLMPAGQRERYTRSRVKRAAPPKRASPVLAYAAPRELRATSTWRMARGTREQAALVQAWAQRDTSPEAWRAMVRRMHERGAT
jgi:hypothetical protein